MSTIQCSFSFIYVTGGGPCKIRTPPGVQAAISKSKTQCFIVCSFIAVAPQRSTTLT